MGDDLTPEQLNDIATALVNRAAGYGVALSRPDGRIVVTVKLGGRNLASLDIGADGGVLESWGTRKPFGVKATGTGYAWGGAAFVNSNQLAETLFGYLLRNAGV